jgi:hypothetical protein
MIVPVGRERQVHRLIGCHHLAGANQGKDHQSEKKTPAVAVAGGRDLPVVCWRAVVRHEVGCYVVIGTNADSIQQF